MAYDARATIIDQRFDHMIMDALVDAKVLCMYIYFIKGKDVS